MQIRNFLMTALAVGMFSTVGMTASADFEDVTDSTSCGFEMPEEEVYDASVVTVRRQLRVEEGDEFKVKVYIKNSGNMPWFRADSKCLGPKMSLGTDRERDAVSVFYEEGEDGWEAGNRIAMDQERVDPGKLASFTFTATAPDEADVVKQYLTPVLAGIAWLDQAGTHFDVMVGETGETVRVLREKVRYAGTSGSVMDLNLDGDKTLVVDRRNQFMILVLDDKVVRKFPVSTGAPATPTPKGVTKIELKQEVRVGGQPPHYIMPKFMWFRAGGYGFHALPSLGKPNSGYFWEEALDHIGIPVSHGCVRLLPDDANFVFDFTEVGTTVVVTENIELNESGTYDVSKHL